ncbi:MAG: response regulator [Marinicaulis sp.]|nr:response regulator [Marinicaulis sp.]NNE41387.1 response regulator [Marinicaulis sp.]NNL89445.1 response regulator [Marinicaulis sp.]
MNTAAPNSDNTPHILIVDDDDRIRSLIKRYLSENGYLTSAAENAQEARVLMAALDFDLLILDVMMPGESGFDLTKSIRAASNIPILLLTARGLSEDRIIGLERGADDYMSKPFEPRELLLRINALLRRTRSNTPDKATLTFGSCTFSLGRGELRRDGELIKLTASETALLKALAKKPGEPISRRTLAEQTSSALERSIDVQVTRIRKKTEENPRAPVYLQTVRGVGYVLMAD